jgi:thiamine pyrophosphate-dependent acetolactate synthase large subunit-like protein
MTANWSQNNSLGEVRFEQMELGNPEYGCTLSIDFVAFAKAFGADGFRCERTFCCDAQTV